MASGIRRVRTMVLAVALLLSLAGLVACSGSTTKSASGAKSAGGTAVLAQLGFGPNYIFPLTPAQFFYGPSRTNLQAELYRPLYWFGVGNNPTVDYSRSIAYPPVFSNGNKTVTIKLRKYTWSDGVPVTARDIVFWQNLVTANKADWGGYAPGNYPDNVIQASAIATDTVRFTLTKAYDKNWFLYNELSQITPLPQHAWDKASAAGAVGDYDQSTAGAVSVRTFLDAQSRKLSTYATNPLWKVVDGPWTLRSYTPSTGGLTLVPNPKYQGSHKASLDSLVEQTFTSTDSQEKALLSGSGPDVGFISPVELKDQPALDRQGYAMTKSYSFGISYNQLNFNNPVVGPIFAQTYVRQALQLLVDQVGINTAYYAGAGYPTCGPIPTKPDNDFADATSKSCPYAFNPAKAVALLTSHGWNVVKGGTTTCARPGSGLNECGAGIAAGASLKFTLSYATGGIAYPKTLQQEKSDAAQAGIVLTLDDEPGDQLAQKVIPCKSSQNTCSWQMAGTGWLYSPNYYPTGESLFATGAGFNAGSYSDPKADALIAASTEPGDSQQTLDAYQDYIVEQNPVIWQTNTDSLNEVRKTLHGVAPFNVFGWITPEEWYFSK